MNLLNVPMHCISTGTYISPSITQKVLKVITLSPQKNTVLRWGGGVDYRLMRRGGLMNLLNIYSVMLSKFINPLPSSSDNTPPPAVFFFCFFLGGGLGAKQSLLKLQRGDVDIFAFKCFLLPFFFIFSFIFSSLFIY